MTHESLHADNCMHIALISSLSQKDGEVSESFQDQINYFELTEVPGVAHEIKKN